MKYYSLFMLFALLFTAASCNDSTKDTQPDGEQTGELDPSRVDPGEKMPMREPLMILLEQRKEKFYQTADPDVIEIYELGIDEVRNMNIAENALSVEDKIPMFSLPDATGDTVSIAKLLEEGPVVLMWYRGPWCPYCNIQLREMQAYRDFINEQGASLVAISPTLPDSSMSMKERMNIEYHVLSDSGNVVANQFGLMYKLPEKVANELQRHHSFKKYYGNTAAEVPLTMTYVVDTTGTIRYAFGEADYRMRAEPHEVMDVLVELANPEAP